MKHKQVIPLALVVVMTLSLGFAMIQPAQSVDYLFTTTIIAPTNNPVRVQHAQLITNELPRIGIQGNLLLVGWDVLIPRLFGSLTHADYAGGGFDIGFVGWSGGIVPTGPFQFFHSSNIDPASWASNYYPVNNATLDGYLAYTMNTTDFNQRKEWVGKALKSIVWDIHPVTGIYQEESVYYLRDNIRGFDSTRFQITYPIEEAYFSDGHAAGHGQANEIVVASTSRPQSYNLMISNSWYDTMVYAPAFNALVTRDSDLNFIPELLTKLPYPVPGVVNNHDGQPSSSDPNTATVWEVEIRNDVYWHEGYGYTMADDSAILRFDADDVVWNFEINIDSNGPPSPARGFFQFAFGTDPSKAVVKIDDYHVQFHLANLYADLMTIFAGMLPQHILDATYDAGYGSGVRKDGTSAPVFTDWNVDDYNQGKRTSGDITHAATIGTGPYVLYPGENEIQQTVTLTKNTNYFKDGDPYWDSLITNRPDKYIYTWIVNKDSAEIALEQADIDLMDANFAAGKDYPVMKNKPGIKVDKQLDWGYQTMGYNIMNGAAGKLANKYVRLAISHMIPRQDVVDYLLGGLGQPSFVPFPQQSPFWPDDLKPIVYNYTRALEYMEMAGYDPSPFLTTQASPGFEVLAFFAAMGGMATVVLVYRHRKQAI
ncbi:MAG: ABC transporter substrate-binding protein [Candidatus Hodarchaeota archaeon]